MRRSTLGNTGILALTAVLAASGALYGCGGNDNDDNGTTARDVGRQAERLGKTTMDFAAETRDDMVREVEKRLETVGSQIDEYRGRLEELSGDARTRMNELLDDADQRRQALAEELRQLRGSTGDAWKEMREGFTDAFSELRDSLDRARREFGN